METSVERYYNSPVGPKDDFGDTIEDIIIDARTKIGAWALMTPKSFEEKKRNPVTCGQKYQKQPDGRWLKIEDFAVQLRESKRKNHQVKVSDLFEVEGSKCKRIIYHELASQNGTINKDLKIQFEINCLKNQFKNNVEGKFVVTSGRGEKKQILLFTSSIEEAVDKYNSIQ